MRIEFDVKALKRNFQQAESIVQSNGCTLSLMVKAFYKVLKLEEHLSPEYLWHQDKGYSYVIREREQYHKGGVITSLYDIPSKKFDSVVPVNFGGNRDGMELLDAVHLIKASKEIGTPIRKAMITAGCLHGNVSEPKLLEYVCQELKSKGIEHISIGGSYFVEWAKRKVIPPQVDDIRIGEYALYGTIPFIKGSDIPKWEDSCIKLTLPMVEDYPRRRMAIYRGGSAMFNAEDSWFHNLQGCTLENQSTEYVILNYETHPPKQVEMIPDYHSLVKLLNYEIKLAQ